MVLSPLYDFFENGLSAFRDGEHCLTGCSEIIFDAEKINDICFWPRDSCECCSFFPEDECWLKMLCFCAVCALYFFCFAFCCSQYIMGNRKSN
jgi:hypothetical protein